MSLDLSVLTNGIALLAVLAASLGVAAPARRSPVAMRLRILYRLVAALLALRLVAHVVSWPWLSVLVMAVAAWLPLAVLRLVEELRRRHAPKLIKYAALLGGFAFTVIAVPGGLLFSAGAATALAVFQAAMFLAMLGLLAGARSDVSPAERRTNDTLFLALLLTVPLAVTDFPALLPDLPVRGGAFAVLILVLATSRLASGRGSARQLLTDIGLMVLGAALAVLAANAAGAAAYGETMILLAAAGAASAALLMLIERFAGAKTDGAGVTAAIAAAPDEPAALLASHPLLATGRVLGAETLAAYPQASLDRLAGYRVVSQALEETDARDAARDLLDAANATHLLRLSKDPPRFLAVAAGDLASPALDDELEIAARLVERST